MINYFYSSISWSKNLVKFSHKAKETFNQYLEKSKEACTYVRNGSLRDALERRLQEPSSGWAVRSDLGPVLSQ